LPEFSPATIPPEPPPELSSAEPFEELQPESRTAKKQRPTATGTASERNGSLTTRTNAAKARDGAVEIAFKSSSVLMLGLRREAYSSNYAAFREAA
jgi:hypothetical protein